MKKKQIKYIVLVLLTGVTGFGLYCQDPKQVESALTAEQQQQEKHKRYSRAMKIYLHMYPEMAGKVSPYLKPVEKSEKVVDISVKEGLSQSQAFLSVISREASLRRIGLTDEDIKKLQPVITKIIKQEKQHPGYFAFYHGMDKEFMILLDILKYLHALFEQVQIKDFEFLRSPGQFAQSLTPQEFLEKYKEKLHVRFDNEGDISRQILSTNLSIPGQLVYPTESSLYYFSHSINAFVDLNNAVKGVMDTLYAQQNPDYIQLATLIAMADILKLKQILEATNYGLLLQIFVPETLVDKTVYLSIPGGTPVKQKIFELAGFSQELGYQLQITPILKALRENPKVLKHYLESLQARIILREDLFSRPGIIKIDRYHMMPPQAYKEWYLPSVKQLTDKIFRDWLIRPSMDVLLKKGLDWAIEFSKSVEAEEQMWVVDLLQFLLERKYRVQELVPVVGMLLKNINVSVPMERTLDIKEGMPLLKKFYINFRTINLLKDLAHNKNSIQKILPIALSLAKEKKISSLDLFLMTIEQGYGLTEALPIAMQFAADYDGKLEVLDFFETLVKRGDGIKEALIVASMLNDYNPDLKKQAVIARYQIFYLLKQRVKPDRSFLKTLALLATASEPFDINKKARQLLELISQKIGVQKMTEFAFEFVNMDNPRMQGTGLLLFKYLVQRGYEQSKAFELAIEFSKNKDQVLRTKAFYILEALINQYYELEKMLDLAIKFSHDEKQQSQVWAINLFRLLIPKGYGLQEALATGLKNSNNEKVDIQKGTIGIFVELVNQDFAVSEIAKVTLNLMKSEDEELRKLAEKLMNIIREHKRKTGGAKL